MPQPIQLSLPLSAFALRLGADFLNSLAEHADAIRTEERGPMQPVGELSYTLDLDTSAAAAKLRAMIESAVIAETEAERLYRLHGNIGSSGMEPATPKPEPVIEYETQVIGVERNPEYTGPNAQFSHEQMTEAGWTDEALIADGYLIEVTAEVPKAPAAATVPTPPAPPGAASAASVAGTELDADGLPWDERIHSKAAEPKAATGKWKTRKNLPAGYKEQIEAELRSGTTASPSAPAPTPVAPSAPPAAPPAPAAVAAPAAPTPPSAPGAMDFPAFTRWALGHVNAKRMSNTDVALAIQGVGLTIMPDLAKRPDLIPQVVADLTESRGL